MKKSTDRYQAKIGITIFASFLLTFLAAYVVYHTNWIVETLNNLVLSIVVLAFLLGSEYRVFKDCFTRCAEAHFEKYGEIRFVFNLNWTWNVSLAIFLPFLLFSKDVIVSRFASPDCDDILVNLCISLFVANTTIWKVALQSYITTFLERKHTQYQPPRRVTLRRKH